MKKSNEIRRKPYLKDEIFLKELGEHIRNIRKAKGITQEHLANTINVEISQISRLERGILNVSVSMLKDIALALNNNLSNLLDFEYSENFSNPL